MEDSVQLTITRPTDVPSVNNEAKESPRIDGSYLRRNEAGHLNDDENDMTPERVSLSSVTESDASDEIEAERIREEELDKIVSECQEEIESEEKRLEFEGTLKRSKESMDLFNFTDLPEDS